MLEKLFRFQTVAGLHFIMIIKMNCCVG